MTGLQKGVVRSTDIILHQQSRLLEIAFDDGKRFKLSCEYLRVRSPSAEVRGHGAAQEALQTGKKDVTIQAVEPVGNYAVKLVFSDGHATGLSRGTICIRTVSITTCCGRLISSALKKPVPAARPDSA